MDTPTIIMFDKVKFLTLRIRKVLEGSRICAVETTNENTLFNTINKLSNDVSLILMDLDMESKFAMDLLIEARKRAKTVPIIIMTSEAKKALFIEAMLQGATDFIVKPFTDQLLVEKVQKYLVPQDYSNTQLITLDLNQYIKGELHKAEKGNFPLSLMFTYFENSSTDTTTARKTSNFIFNYMKSQFWDTDLFIRFAAEHGLGIFPFCDDKNIAVLKAKNKLKFEKLKKENEILKDCSMICAFISYPHDSTEIDKIFNLFIGKINAKFENINLSSQEDK